MGNAWIQIFHWRVGSYEKWLPILVVKNYISAYEVMISGIKEKIEAQKEAVFVLENRKPSDNSGLKFLEGNSEVAEITDELLDALLEKIVVYEDKTIELRWKFSNRSN